MTKPGDMLRELAMRCRRLAAGIRNQYHPAVDALLEMAAELELQADAIDSVTARDDEPE